MQDQPLVHGEVDVERTQNVREGGHEQKDPQKKIGPFEWNVTAKISAMMVPGNMFVVVRQMRNQSSGGSGRGIETGAHVQRRSRRWR